MIMLCALAEVGVFLSNTSAVLCVFIFGYYFLDERAFRQAFMLVLFTMVYNLYLKSIWQLPLQPPLEGWAFPSGHMHAQWVFWGWMACTAWKAHQKRLIPCYAIILALNMYGMIHHHYHTMHDLLGAIGFGSVTLLLFRSIDWWLHRQTFKHHLWIESAVLSVASLFFLSLIPMPWQVKPHLWYALGGLCGMSIGGFLLTLFRDVKLTNIQLLIQGGTCIVGLLGIHYIWQPLMVTTPSVFVYMSKTVALGAWIIMCKPLFQAIVKNKTLCIK